MAHNETATVLSRQLVFGSPMTVGQKDVPNMEPLVSAPKPPVPWWLHFDPCIRICLAKAPAHQRYSPETKTMTDQKGQFEVLGPILSFRRGSNPCSFCLNASFQGSHLYWSYSPHPLRFPAGCAVDGDRKSWRCVAVSFWGVLGCSAKLASG